MSLAGSAIKTKPTYRVASAASQAHTPALVHIVLCVNHKEIIMTIIHNIEVRYICRIHNGETVLNAYVPINIVQLHPFEDIAIIVG